MYKLLFTILGIILLASCSSTEEVISETSSYNDNTLSEQKILSFDELIAKNPQINETVKDALEGNYYFSPKKVNERVATRERFTPEQNAKSDNNARMCKEMCKYLAFEGNDIVVNLSMEEAVKKGITPKFYQNMVDDINRSNSIGGNTKGLTIYYSSFSSECFTLLNPNYIE